METGSPYLLKKLNELIEVNRVIESVKAGAALTESIPRLFSLT
jgi:hypothetical protein